MQVECQPQQGHLYPTTSISLGRRVIAQRLQAVIKATIVPILVPRSLLQASDNREAGIRPAGDKATGQTAQKNPLKPDSLPTQRLIASLGIKAWMIPERIRAKKSTAGFEQITSPRCLGR